MKISRVVRNQHVGCFVGTIILLCLTSDSLTGQPLLIESTGYYNVDPAYDSLEEKKMTRKSAFGKGIIVNGGENYVKKVSAAINSTMAYSSCAAGLINWQLQSDRVLIIIDPLLYPDINIVENELRYTHPDAKYATIFVDLGKETSGVLYGKEAGHFEGMFTHEIFHNYQRMAHCTLMIDDSTNSDGISPGEIPAVQMENIVYSEMCIKKQVEIYGGIHVWGKAIVEMPEYTGTYIMSTIEEYLKCPSEFDAYDDEFRRIETRRIPKEMKPDVKYFNRRLVKGSFSRLYMK